MQLLTQTDDQTDNIEFLKRRIEELEKIAYQCSLTGLPNRRRLDDRLSQEWNRAKRSQQTIAVLFLDLNGFKQINDTLGHEAGDRILQQVGSALRSIPLRSYDFIARYAGDEFIFVLPDTSIHGASRIASQIQEVLSKIKVTASIGVAACVPCVGSDYSQLLKSADASMYEIKRKAAV
jgi:diguanylate cyclase (GGDEF)-like protein